MAYIFYTLLVIFGIFFVAEAVEFFKGRKWGENP